MLSNVKKGDLIVTGDQQSFIVLDTDYDKSKYPINIVAVYPMSACLSIKHKELFIKESDFNQTYKHIDSNLELISTGLFQNNLIIKASNKTYNLSSKKRILMSTLEKY